jgi:hypothetical protein
MLKNPNHNIPELRKEYKTLFPGERFVFDTPWRFSAKDLEDFGFGPVSDSSIHRNPDQLYKYGMDKKGNVASGVFVFTPGYLFNYMLDLGEKWTWIWQTIRTGRDG